MDSARWEQVQTVFHEALERPEAERRAFLQAACAGDPELIDEVAGMLAADEDSRTSLLDRGLPEIAYHVVGTLQESLPARAFGPYRLIRILGEGGMGVVWLAERADAGNLVAIKFLPHAGLSPARRERFASEIRMLAKLKHPYIARLYDAGSLADGTPWFVMEYVEGLRFTEYCDAGERSIEERLRLFRSVCEAVQYAHGQEIIHRDLKPSNILVEADGTPRLLDFGIARELQHSGELVDRTRPGLRFMTPGYAAPEWEREGIVGFYTDVYSLGVILYEMLTGRMPYARSQDEDVHGVPEKPSALAERASGSSGRTAWNDLDVLCLKAIQREPLKRYSSVEALIRDLDHYLKNEPLEARPDALSYRASKFIVRNRRPVIAVSIVFFLVAGLIVFYTFRLARARNAALVEAARTQRIQRFMVDLFQGGDEEAGPAEDMRVVTLLDRGVQEAQALNTEPEMQADLYQTLGVIYQQLGQLNRADTLLQSALAGRRAQQPQNDAAVAESLIALGQLRADQGNAKEAERLAREALGMVQARLPRNRPLLAKATLALGNALLQSGANGQAVDVLKQAIALQPASPGSSTAGSNTAGPDMAKALKLSGDAQIYLGNYAVADTLNQRALAIDRQIHGNNHPRVADDLQNLGSMQEMWGHYPQAEQYERQALAMTKAWYGEDHPASAEKMAALAATLIYEDQYDEANRLLLRALTIQQRVFGEMHPHVAYVLNMLGSVANARKDRQSSIADYQRTIEIYRSAYGDRDYRVAVAMANLASTYLADRQYAKAEQIFRQVVDRLTNTLSPDNINTAIAQVKLGRTLRIEHSYAEAEAHSRAGYEALLKQTSPSTSFIHGAREDLALEYDSLHQPAKAAVFRTMPAGKQ